MFSQAKSFYLKRSPLSADTPGSTARWRDSTPHFQLSKHTPSHTHLHKLSHSQHAHSCFKLNWGIDWFLHFLREQTNKQPPFFPSGLSLAPFVALSGCGVTLWTILDIIHLKRSHNCAPLWTSVVVFLGHSFTRPLWPEGRWWEEQKLTWWVASSSTVRGIWSSIVYVAKRKSKLPCGLFEWQMPDSFCLYMWWFI